MEEGAASHGAGLASWSSSSSSSFVGAAQPQRRVLPSPRPPAAGTLNGSSVSSAQSAAECKLEVHRRWKTRYCWRDEKKPSVVAYRDVHLNIQSEVTKMTCLCQICKSRVGVTRFAAHLETCQRRSRQRSRLGTGRGSVSGTSASGSLLEDIDGRNTPKSNGKKRTQNPSSLVQMKRPRVEAEKRQNSELETQFEMMVNKNALPVQPLTFRCVCGNESEIDDNSVMCDACDRCYHIACVEKLDGRFESLTEAEIKRAILVPNSPWFCNECQLNVKAFNNGHVSIPANFGGATAGQKVYLFGRRHSQSEKLEYYCNVCSRPLKDYRWRCLVCHNFDACPSCNHKISRHEMALPETRHLHIKPFYHRPDHVMAKIQIDMSKMGEKKD